MVRALEKILRDLTTSENSRSMEWSGTHSLRTFTEGVAMTDPFKNIRIFVEFIQVIWTVVAEVGVNVITISKTTVHCSFEDLTKNKLTIVLSKFT